MDIPFGSMLWIIAIMLFTGFLVMKLAGRKSLSKMTISQAVIMIAVGSLMVEPIKEASEGAINITVFSLLMFVLLLYMLEFLALNSKTFERFWIGSPKILIENGNINYDALKKIRISETQLQMLIREKGASRVSDVKTLVIEPNGNVSIQKYEEKVMTIADFKRLTGDFFRGYEKENTDNGQKSPNLFEEVKNGEEKN